MSGAAPRGDEKGRRVVLEEEGEIGGEGGRSQSAEAGRFGFWRESSESQGY